MDLAGFDEEVAGAAFEKIGAFSSSSGLASGVSKGGSSLPFDTVGGSTLGTEGGSCCRRDAVVGFSSGGEGDGLWGKFFSEAGTLFSGLFVDSIWSPCRGVSAK